RGRQRLQVGPVVDEEGIEAVVIEADGVEQTGGGFDGSPGSVAGARCFGDRLGEDAAELAEIDERLHLASVTKRARGSEDGVAERESPQLNGKIGCGHGILPEYPGGSQLSQETASPRRTIRWEQPSPSL